VDALESTLGGVLSVAGASGVAVVDAVTGLTYAETGDCTAAGSGFEVCRLLNLIEDRLHEAGAEGELENVVVTGSRNYHIVHVVSRQGDPVLMSALLDRSEANLALASRQVAAACQDLFA
jgi:hypothetical protein